MNKLNFLNEIAIDEDTETEVEIDETTDETTDEIDETTDEIDETDETEDTTDYKAEHEKLKGQMDYYNSFMSNIYKDYGVTDLASFEKLYKEDIAKQQQAELDSMYSDLESQGISKSTIEELINKHPAFKEVETLKNELTELRNKEKINVQMQTEFDELKKDFPEFKNMADLSKLPKETQENISAYVGKGYTLKDAYVLSNYNDIVGKSQQNALNKVNGKSHLKTGKSSGDEIDLSTIDQEELRWYKGLNPKASDKQIMEHFKKSSKK